MNISKIIFCLLLLFPVCLGLSGQEKTDQTSEQEDVTATLAEFLRPAAFSMGISPNLQGQLDGQLNFFYRWNDFFSSGIRGGYYGSSYEERAESSDAEYSGKTFAKNYNANLTFLEFIWTKELGESGGLGLACSLETSYMGSQDSTSGYKTSQGETVYFNRDKTRHQILPALYLSFLAGKKEVILSEISGTYLPLVLILENGEKLYSTYDETIPYSLTNLCQAVRGSITLNSLALPIGNFRLTGDYLWVFGKYGTRQDIINGNYLTTIKTYSDYQMHQIRGALEYRMNYLEKKINVIPSLMIGTTYSWEVFDSIKGTPIQNIQIGVSLGS